MRKLLAFVTVLCLSANASATEWHNLGARAMGMGGTGTALAQGPIGAYWNPAGLDQANNPSGVELPFSGHAAITGSMIQGANDLSQLQKDCQAGMADCTDANIQNALNKLDAAGSGARADIGGGLFFKLKQIAVFADDIADIGANASVDRVNTQQVNVKNNTSAIVLRGISATQFGVAYGHELPFARGVMIGGALKGIIGRVGYARHQLVGSSESSSTGFLGDFSKNTKSSFQPGIDLGAIWDLSRTFTSVPFHPRLALAAHDINNPTFAEPDLAKSNGEKSRYSLQGNSRAGFAISPLGFINVTADLDITRNLTAASGVASRYGGVGVEVNVLNRPWLNIPLRAGLSRNLAESGAKTMIALGGGLHVFHFNLDLGVNWSPKKLDTQTVGSNKTIPGDFGAGLTLGVLF